MSWGGARFAEFFAAVNSGAEPYGWQRRLVDRVVQTGRWPDVITAPTGSGKSSVVDIHVFSLAATAGTDLHPPRRMSVVVNRRALVDAHLDRAEKLRVLLEEAAGGVLAECAGRLRSLSGTDCALLVTSLRGGIATNSTWIDDPRLPAVLAMTPDMWGSRLMFRGYGTSRYARPREAGLLAIDSVVVLDEAHLNRQLLQTARDAAQIVEDGLQGSALATVPGLQVVATTATPVERVDDNTAVTEGVQESDLAVDLTLREVLTRPKPVTLVTTSASTAVGAASGRYLDLLTDQALQVATLVDQPTDLAGTVLCVVNTVKAAVGLAERLEKHVGASRVVCWVGRMRPMDLQRVRADRADLFTLRGDATVDFLVATQTVEVGIDIDCAALVTELAPASALAQRCGRVNRRGRRAAGPIRVVVPEGSVEADRPPYLAADLQLTKAWLEGRGDAGLSPWSLVDDPPPESALARLALSDLNREHLDLMTQTSDPLVAELNLDFWLRDSLDDRDDSVGIAVRGPLPDDDTLALALLRATPLDAREIFPATRSTAAAALDRVLAANNHGRAFCWRAGELGQVGVGDRVQPGDNLVVDTGHSLTRRGVVVDAPPTVAEAVDAVWGDEGLRVVLPGSQDDHWLTDFVGVTSEQAQQLMIDTDPSLEGLQVVLPPMSTGTEELPWLVLRPSTQVVRDTELRQEWSPAADSVVTLHQHRTAVAGRARQLADDLQLAAVLGYALEEAGLRHDDGKADAEFQSLLQDRHPPQLGVVLAKSLRRNAQQSQRRKSGAGWRHEQMSAVHAWQVLSEDPMRDLVVRLVGTSHGRGRPFFPLGARSLLGGRYPQEVAAHAEALFQTGAGWSRVLDSTDRAYGPWGVAFLESVLRAADCQVSAEGS